jgi:hypothetical protein
MCRMAFSMPNAKILSHEVSIAIRIIASIYVLGRVVELVAIEMLGTRIAFATAVVLTFKLLVGVWLHDPSSLLGRFISLDVG